MTNFRRLKNVATIVACFAAALFFSAALVSCNKDDNNGDTGQSTLTGTSITANVEGGSALNNLIDEVKLVAYNKENYDQFVVLATAKFTNGGFKIDLPGTVPSSVLESFDEDFLTDITVSNMNVKTTWAYTKAYDKDGQEIGGFYYYKEDGNTGVIMGLVYAEGDVNITGSSTPHENVTSTYSVSLKKGWNQVFEIEKELPDDKWEYTRTTANQSGMKWIFED